MERGFFLSVDKRGKGEQTTKKWNAQSFHSFILSVSKTPSNEMNRRTVTSISLVAVFDYIKEYVKTMERIITYIDLLCHCG